MLTRLMEMSVGERLRKNCACMKTVEATEILGPSLTTATEILRSLTGAAEILRSS